MKSIVNSQLTGKWYLIAQSQNGKLMRFLEVFAYVSISCGKLLDLLFVGIRSDGNKVLKKLSLNLLIFDGDVYMVVKNAFIRKKLKILTFDEKNELIIFVDDKTDCLSIYSRKSRVKQDVLESCLSEIDFSKLNKKSIKLYSGSVV